MKVKNAPKASSVDAAMVFAALGDPIRLEIVTRLGDNGPLPTVQLKRGTNLTRQAVTKHLRVLEDVGLVRSSRAGRNRTWRIDTRELAKSRTYLDRISMQWERRLERLRALVEDDV